MIYLLTVFVTSDLAHYKVIHSVFEGIEAQHNVL